MQNTTDFSGRKLAVLCGTSVIADISRCAKEMGLHLITVRKRRDVPIHRYSDEQWYADSFDDSEVLPLLQKHHVDAILACSGEKMQRRCIDWICGSEYRFYATKAQWDILMHKHRFKQYAAKFGIPPIPEYRIDRTACCAAEPVRFPVVVKPADNSGSSGITVCTEQAQLAGAIAFAAENSCSGDVLCEACLNGSYFQFEIWLQNGRAYFPYTKERLFYPRVGSCPPQPFLDLYPSSYASLLSEKLFEPIRQMMLSLGIRDGSCMFQGMIQDGIPYIMDTAFRLSSGMDFLIVKEETGADQIRAYILQALTGEFGGDFSVLEKPFRHVYATLCIGLKNGTITEVSGLDEIRQKPYVYECMQHYEKGYVIRNSGRFSQTAFRIFLKAAHREQLGTCIREVLELLEVRDENGCSMLLDFPALSIF